MVYFVMTIEMSLRKRYEGEVRKFRPLVAPKKTKIILHMDHS